MNGTVDLQTARLLAEILRLQRWAGGDSVSSARIFGLMNGFQTAMLEEMNEEADGKTWTGISEEVQDRVEDMLADVEAGNQSTDGMAIKDRLHRDGIDETIAEKVMQLCLLQSRFGDEIEAIVDGKGSPFSAMKINQTPESSWFGALHFVELYDSERNKLHAVFAPSVPRVDEIIQPEGGSLMRVVEVRHVIAQQHTDDTVSRRLLPILIPHVYLEPIEDDGESFPEPAAVPALTH